MLYASRVETGPRFVPGSPHAVAHSRRTDGSQDDGHRQDHEQQRGRGIVMIDSIEEPGLRSVAEIHLHLPPVHVHTFGSQCPTPPLRLVIVKELHHETHASYRHCPVAFVIDLNHASKVRLPKTQPPREVVTDLICKTLASEEVTNVATQDIVGNDSRSVVIEIRRARNSPVCR